jgi:branched-chain amino acid transport system substrate-binding protein
MQLFKHIYKHILPSYRIWLLKKFISLIFLVTIGFNTSNAKGLPINWQQDSTIKIGLLIQDNNSFAARHGAELAINQFNERGGTKRRKFQLEVRSMEGPWGTGSKQAVDLIFDEKVTALMGSHDGRNAHLVEQVSTKARVVFLSCWAGDHTLSQAFVPWFFSCVPNDLSQADAFFNEIYKKRKLNKIAVISEISYDSKMAMESFVKKAESEGKQVSLQLHYDIQTKDFNNLINQIQKADIQAIILYGQSSASLKIKQLLEQKNMNQVVFGSLSLLDEDKMPDHYLTDYKNIVLFYPWNISGPKSLAFRDEYMRKYGKIPGAVAAYSFDGMTILIEAINKAGTDRENIQKTIAKMHYAGVTGLIQFDEKGKRIGTPGFMEIRNGVQVIPGK